MVDHNHTDNQINNGEPKPEDFRVPASDTHGHATGMTFRIQPGHERQLRSASNSGLFPYRTIGDVLRHAVKRHLDWLDTLSPVPSVTKEVDNILEIIREDEFRADYKHVLEALGRNIAQSLVAGEVDRARAMIIRIRSGVENMPEGYWRDKYMGEINNKYGYLLNSQPSTPPTNLLDIG